MRLRLLGPSDVADGAEFHEIRLDAAGAPFELDLQGRYDRHRRHFALSHSCSRLARTLEKRTCGA